RFSNIAVYPAPRGLALRITAWAGSMHPLGVIVIPSSARNLLFLPAHAISSASRLSLLRLGRSSLRAPPSTSPDSPWSSAATHAPSSAFHTENRTRKP